MLVNSVGMFLLGVVDSMSLEWVTAILLFSDPQSKTILPHSQKLLMTLSQSAIQVCLFLTALPLLLSLLSLDILSTIVATFTLLGTYGYLFFYNNDILSLTQKVVRWKKKLYPTLCPELDVKEQIELFSDLANQAKSIIFLLLYYLPIFLFALSSTFIFSIAGTLLLVISESFFNSAFYFLKKWPYNKYNIGFMEKNLAYMLGYGLFVSVVCNFLLPPSLARPAYFLLSQWMIINAVLHSPPSTAFQSWQQVMDTLKNSSIRRKLKNGYNAHRDALNRNDKYRKEIISSIVLFKPLFALTELINSRLSKHLVSRSLPNKHSSAQQVQQVNETESETKTNSAPIERIEPTE